MKQLFKSVFFFVIFFISSNIFAQVQKTNLPIVIINEIDYSGPTLEHAFIELLVLADDKIPYSNLQKDPNFIIDDTNIIDPNGGNSGDMEPGFISLKPECLEELKPGDLVVIHGTDTDISGAGDAVLFSINDPCVEKFDNSPTPNNSES